MYSATAPVAHVSLLRQRGVNAFSRYAIAIGKTKR